MECLKAAGEEAQRVNLLRRVTRITRGTLLEPPDQLARASKKTSMGESKSSKTPVNHFLWQFHVMSIMCP